MKTEIVLLTLGGIFLAGLFADEIGRRTRLPRVTLLLLCGVAVGGSGFDLIPSEAELWYEFLSVSALTMVAFLLGGSLTGKSLRAHGREIMWLSVSIVAVTLALVTAGLYLIGVPLGAAMILGAIATATAPAATQDTIRQSGISGPFPRKLIGIVAVDDAWGLIAFSLVAVLAGQLNGSGGHNLFGEALWEMGGALALGVAVGAPAAYLTGRLAEGEPLQTEALGVVFLTAGLAQWLEVSYLIAGMTAGSVIVNFARHHKLAFHEIEHIQWPFMVLFFVLAGASLEIEQLREMGIVGLAYMVLRTISRFAGGWIGARLGGSPAHQRNWFGVALLPQAGVAIGMALVAAETFPEWAATIMTLTVGTTVAFEVLGPAGTILALRRVERAER